MQPSSSPTTETISLSPEIVSSVKLAIDEDMGAGDATTDSIVPLGARLKGKIISKESGVVAGLSVAQLTFKLLDGEATFIPLVQEGEQVEANQTLAEVAGGARALLSAERALEYRDAVKIEVKARTLAEVAQALNQRVRRIRPDNISLDDTCSAVELNAGRVEL